MKLNKTALKAVAMLIVAAVCFTLFSAAAYSLSLETKGSITLHVADSETKMPLAGASFRLYLFAAAYESGDGVGYDYVVPYDDCNMDMDNLQDAYLPIHLTHFANTHSLPFTEITSDENGYIFFDSLDPGVYLIVPSSRIDNYFMPTPFVVNIPLYDDENKSWVYDINATPKMRIYSGSDTESFTYISARKVWDTRGSHPESVTVSLLRDFQQVDTVELSSENNWSFRWDNLSAAHNWNIVENVPDGYRVSYETSSNTVTIINESTSPEDDDPKEPTTEEDELIYTGQLNWPVPVLVIAGLLLFSLGWAMLNLGRKEDTCQSDGEKK